MTSKCKKCTKEMTEWAQRNCEGFCTQCFPVAPPYVPTVEEDEWDFPEGTTCNPDAPEECESCQ